MYIRTFTITGTTPRTEHSVEPSVEPIEHQAVYGSQPSQVGSQLPGSNVAGNKNVVTWTNGFSVGILILFIILGIIIECFYEGYIRA